MRFTNKATLWGFILIFLSTACVWSAEQKPVKRGQGRQQAKSQVVVGEYAPDVNLPRLKITKSEDGKPIGLLDTKNRFHLAALRGKRPVCMIMSSYT